MDSPDLEFYNIKRFMTEYDRRLISNSNHTNKLIAETIQRETQINGLDDSHWRCAGCRELLALRHIPKFNGEFIPINVCDEKCFFLYTLKSL